MVGPVRDEVGRSSRPAARAAVKAGERQLLDVVDPSAYSDLIVDVRCNMPREIFISLTKQDRKIVEALRDLLASLLGETVRLRFSTSMDLDEGIGHGEDWFQWIVKRVQECDFALIILTPASAPKPWILWESGAVYGAALASGQGGMRKIRPLVYQLAANQIPSPIEASKVQVLRGEDHEDMEKFCKEIVLQYKEDLGYERYGKAREKMSEAVAKYCARVSELLRLAPALPTPAMIDEWRGRLEALLKARRESEVRHLQRWIDIAFGRDKEDSERPLDVRLHSVLADAYVLAGEHVEAIRELDLARQLAPRDIYLLRKLGKACLDAHQPDRAANVLERIEALDREAFVHNQECAALKGRWLRQRGDTSGAIAVFESALKNNSNVDSHYLANLLAEAQIEADRLEDARTTYRDRVLPILRRLQQHNERNLWTHATAANAHFVLGDDDAARGELRAVLEARPDPSQIASIKRGLAVVAGALPGGDQRLLQLTAILDGEPPQPAQT